MLCEVCEGEDADVEGGPTEERGTRLQSWLTWVSCFSIFLPTSQIYLDAFLIPF